MQAGEMGLNPIDLKQEWKQVQERLAADSWVMGETLGYRQVVRQQILILLFAGPNPATPTKIKQTFTKKWFEMGWQTKKKI